MTKEEAILAVIGLMGTYKICVSRLEAQKLVEIGMNVTGAKRLTLQEVEDGLIIRNPAPDAAAPMVGSPSVVVQFPYGQ